MAISRCRQHNCMKRREFWHRACILRRDRPGDAVSSNLRCKVNKWAREAGLTWCKAELTNKARIQAEADDSVLNSHYCALSALDRLHHFAKRLVLNADETGSGLYELGQEDVLAVKAQNHRQTEGDKRWKNGKHVTTMVGVSAAGSVMPLWFNFPGVMVSSSASNILGRDFVDMNESGHFDGMSFQMWCILVLVPYALEVRRDMGSGASKTAQLVIDAAKVHNAGLLKEPVDRGFYEQYETEIPFMGALKNGMLLRDYLESLDIVVYELPANMSARTQPLDVGVFRKLKITLHKSKLSIRRAMLETGNEVHPAQVVFIESFKDGVSVACNRRAIRTAFERSGCWPPSLEQVAARCNRKVPLDTRMALTALRNGGVCDLEYKQEGISYNKKYGKPVTGRLICLAEEKEKEKKELVKQRKEATKRAKEEAKRKQQEEKEAKQARKAEAKRKQQEEKEAKQARKAEAKRAKQEEREAGRLAVETARLAREQKKRQREEERVSLRPKRRRVASVVAGSTSNDVSPVVSASGRLRRSPAWLEQYI